MRVAEQPGRRVTPQVLGRLRVRIGAFAAGIKAALAEEALAARDRKRNNDAIADLQRLVLQADFDHFAHGLVAEHVTPLHRRYDAVEQMKVGAADRAGRDLDDGVAPVLDFRIGDGVAADVALAVPCQCFHRRSSPRSSPMRRSGRLSCSYRLLKRRQGTPGSGRGCQPGSHVVERAMSASRQFAIVTGASTGIGLELARCCAQHNFDLLIAADEPQIETAAASLRGLGAVVDAVEADLSTLEGVDKLYDASKRIGRPVDALLANAGRGLGRAFLDQDFGQIRHVIDTNVTGTVYL